MLKKLLVVVGFAAALLVGSTTAANAGVTVCANLDVNGQGTGGEQCQTVELPALP